jgi:proline iminopeptidase
VAVLLSGTAVWGTVKLVEYLERPTPIEGETEHEIPLSAHPKHMEWMAGQFPHGRYLYCPNGSHLAIYDDQDTYFQGLIQFIQDVDGGTF